MKIGLFTDCHYSDREISCKTRRPFLSYEKIKEAMRSFVNDGVEAVVILGDLLDSCINSEDESHELERIGTLIRSFGLKVYCLRGNHDCDNFTVKDFYRIGQFEQIPFSIKYGDQLFVFLDANVTENQIAYAPRAVDWTDSFLPHEQLQHLEQELTHTDAEEAVIFIHQRLDDGEDTRYNVKNSADIRDVLERSKKVKRVFQGHYHKGDLKTINGICYTTLPAMCEGEENQYFITNI